MIVMLATLFLSCRCRSRSSMAHMAFTRSQCTLPVLPLPLCPLFRLAPPSLLELGSPSVESSDSLLLADLLRCLFLCFRDGGRLLVLLSDSS